jgi:hypothetical protein
MPATKWNQDINAGQDWMAAVNLLTADGTANRDITGHTLESKVKRHYKSVAPITTVTVMVVDASAGSIRLMLNNTKTSLLKNGKYVYDVELTNTGTGAKERVIEGVFTVRPEVTV